MLGPLEIIKPSSYTTKIINLGDIPISVKHFMEWMTDVLLKKDQAIFSLPTFLNQFFNQYATDYLNNDTCYGGRGKQKVFLHQNALTEYRDNATDDDTITKLCNTPNGIGGPKPYPIKCPAGTIDCTRRLYIPRPYTGKKAILQVMGVRNDPRSNPGLCNEINYLTYYAGRSIPMDKMNGKKSEDHDRGLWHYQIGKDRGIVKTINLSKTDSTGLAEVRFEQEGYDGLRQLRVLYDTTIKSYLDVSAFPGTYIYVDPKGFDPSSTTADGIDLTQLGVGGYCMIWKSEHIIQPGFAESTLHAKWVASRYVSGSTVEKEEKEDCAPTVEQ
jgi:hypothetical protein